MRFARHLRDAQLVDCYYAERARAWVDPRAAEHLADCGACASRYGDLASTLDGIRAEADAETEATFPPERLRLQQQQIAQRLARAGYVAHVLAFPSRARGPIKVAARVAPRWIAAAAAAGLFVGVGTGVFVGAGRHAGVGEAPRVAEAIAVVPPTAAVVVPAQTVETSGDDQAPLSDEIDMFLADLETALDGPRTAELAPFDAFTPHVRDVSATVR